MEKITKFYPQIFNPFSGEKSKILFAKIKKELFRNFYLDQSINHSDSQNDLQEKIQILQNQLNSLQQKVIYLETKVENSKYARRGQNKASEAIKSIQQEDYILNPN